MIRRAGAHQNPCQLFAVPRYVDLAERFLPWEMLLVGCKSPRTTMVWYTSARQRMVVGDRK